ncbi:MAG: citramalate synthase [Alphaproteobacteria bacterium]|nr:citramalate synthase [Alphaproteobacteria bacterium]
MTDRVYLYDSTLRDGAQAMGVDFNLADRQAIAEALDAFGIDYIEGGWPGANPVDDAFFAATPKLKKAKLSAFGMTRRAGRSAANDPGLAALLDTGVSSICLVGKSWDFQVKKALEVSLDENLKMIRDSLKLLKDKKIEAVFDAEHFFDGYKANPDYALSCVKAAYEAGARWIVLCDTNGGSLPHEIGDIVRRVTTEIPGSHLGIHCHNDTENAVANSLAAVQAGVRQVQGTINGVGERCGNANLISLIPTLMLKLGYKTGVTPEKLTKLTHLSRMLDERLNRASNSHAPYVGRAAFAHKGGLHVSAVAKEKSAYEHIDPALVGNSTTILVSDKAGRSNLLAQLKKLGVDVRDGDERLPALLKKVKEREQDGYAYEGADASFALLARRELDTVPDYFELLNFRVLDERRYNARGKLVTMSEATVKLDIGGKMVLTVAEGNGPVNALDSAMRKALGRVYKRIKDIKLVDYKVRILTPQEATKAITRVTIETEDKDGERWTTLGVSPNVIDASYNALHDSITYKLMKDEAKG